jgi:hypothetical protein
MAECLQSSACRRSVSVRFDHRSCRGDILNLSKASAVEPGAKPQRVVDADRGSPAFDQAFALDGVDLARHGLAPCINRRG